MTESYQKNNFVPSSKINDIFIEIFKTTGVSKAIFVKDFKDEQYLTVPMKMIHELVHDTMKLLFKGATSVPYNNNFGQTCSKKTFTKNFSEFYKDIEFIDRDVENEDLRSNIVVIDGTKAFEISGDDTPSGNKLSYTFDSYMNFIRYLKTYNKDLHEEAVALYPEMLAGNITYEQMLYIKPIKDYYDSCIIPSIEEFAHNHPSCNNLQGMGVCNSAEL